MPKITHWAVWPCSLLAWQALNPGKKATPEEVLEPLGVFESKAEAESRRNAQSRPDYLVTLPVVSLRGAAHTGSVRLDPRDTAWPDELPPPGSLGSPFPLGEVFVDEPAVYYSNCCLDNDEFWQLRRRARGLPADRTHPESWLYRISFRYREVVGEIYGGPVPIELLILLDRCHQIHLDFELAADQASSPARVRRPSDSARATEPSWWMIAQRSRGVQPASSPDPEFEGKRAAGLASLWRAKVRQVERLLEDRSKQLLFRLPLGQGPLEEWEQSASAAQAPGPTPAATASQTESPIEEQTRAQERDSVSSTQTTHAIWAGSLEPPPLLEADAATLAEQHCANIRKFKLGYKNRKIRVGDELLAFMCSKRWHARHPISQYKRAAPEQSPVEVNLIEITLRTKCNLSTAEIQSLKDKLEEFQKGRS